ncbi:MAG: glycosyltransferase family 4 protein [Clostridia bacterium]|nr:glycosyltransferase family 4 protein [Clostridia bacterium]
METGTLKILWAVNLIPVVFAEKAGVKTSVLGGWVEAMAAQFEEEKDFELAVACKCDLAEKRSESIDGIKYYTLNYRKKRTEAELIKRCEEIIDDFKPDIIHIEGTEFLHSKVMLEIARKRGIKNVVSAQGILNGQYNYQCGQLPIDDFIFSASLTKIFAGWVLHLRKTRWYKPRMKTERKVLEAAENFLGRTTWDRAHLYDINPKASYYSCNRILRRPFYEKEWKIDDIDRHSVYVGNGYFALKGLHYMLMAMPSLIREYPDIKLYVAGVSPIDKNDKRPIFKKGYSAYLGKLIKDLGIGDHVVFTGPLKAEEVAERLSKTHVYVLTSAIENSPNTLGEAMMIGTPCVASYVGGVPDMAKDGEEALFFRNDDPALIAWNLKKIFDDDDLEAKLSENAKKRARITHDAKLNFKNLINAYNEIMKG